jgi:hypothetical protein
VPENVELRKTVRFSFFFKVSPSGDVVVAIFARLSLFLKAFMFFIKAICSVSLATLASASIFVLVANCGKDSKKSAIQPAPVASPPAEIPQGSGDANVNESEAANTKVEEQKTAENITEVLIEVVPTAQAVKFEGAVQEGFAKYCSTCHTAEFYPMEKPEDFKARSDTGLQNTLAERSADRMKRKIEAGGYMPQVMLAADETQELFRNSETRKLMLEWLKNGSELK